MIGRLWARYRRWREWRHTLGEATLPGMIARNMMIQDLGGAAEDEQVRQWMAGGGW